MPNSVPDGVLEAAILAEAPKQWERSVRNRLKRRKGKARWQREIEDMDSKVAAAKENAKDAKRTGEEMRRQCDPELMRITANLERKMDSLVGELRCPKCGEPDRHNTMNGKAWCMRCNVPLESPFLVKKHLPDVKMLPKTKGLNVTFRGLDQ